MPAFTISLVLHPNIFHCLALQTQKQFGFKTNFVTASCHFKKEKLDWELLKTTHISNTSFYSSTSHAANHCWLEHSCSDSSCMLLAFLQYQSWLLSSAVSIVNMLEKRPKSQNHNFSRSWAIRPNQTAHLQCKILLVDGIYIETNALHRAWPYSQVNTWYCTLSNFHAGFTTCLQIILMETFQDKGVWVTRCKNVLKALK